MSIHRNLTILDSDLRNSIKVQKETRSGQYICDCPFCGKEMHFYIDKKSQLWDCKKCGVTGNIYKLLVHLDKTYLIGNKSVEARDKIISIRNLNNVVEDGDDVEDIPIKKMPIGYRVDLNNAYLKSRGITKRLIEHYKIGTSRIIDRYKNYILIPIYNNKEIRGFLGRYASSKVPDGKLRYCNSLKTDFGKLLFGYDDIVSGITNTIIITEGVFDKFSCDKYLGLLDSDDIKCVSTFGKKISKYQINKLLERKIRNVIISWDFDALKEIKKFGNKLKSYFNVFVCVSMNKKDLGDCNEKELLEIFNNPINIDDFCLDIIGKLKRK